MSDNFWEFFEGLPENIRKNSQVTQEDGKWVLSPKVPVCDFCGQPQPVWTIKAKSFQVTSDIIQTDSMEDWAACEPCGALIEKGDWDSLVTRVKETFPGHLTADPTCFLRGMYKKLRANMIGLKRDEPHDKNPPNKGRRQDNS